jgi:plasmid stabilization system protein ParE
MTQYRFTSAAFTELRQATLYYEQRENGLGLAFLNEIEATLNRILQHPTAWHQLSSRTRRCRTHRFPFGLIYQIRTDEILVISYGPTSRSREMERSAIALAVTA